MLKLLLPLIVVLVGFGVGAGGALFLAPAGTSSQDAKKASNAASTPKNEESTGTNEFVRLSNQFVVPVVTNDQIEAMMVLSLSLEVDPGLTEAIYSREPKLRDIFLRVLFDHANSGGFNGTFTEARMLDMLRMALKETAQKEMGEGVHNVLIIDISRQKV